MAIGMAIMTEVLARGLADISTIAVPTRHQLIVKPIVHTMPKAMIKATPREKITNKKEED
jgi:hypothetical protein